VHPLSGYITVAFSSRCFSLTRMHVSFFLGKHDRLDRLGRRRSARRKGEEGKKFDMGQEGGEEKGNEGKKIQRALGFLLRLLSVRA
jgi:hypothetical protein